MELLNRQLNASVRLIAAFAGLALACGAVAGVPGAVFEHGDVQAGAPGEPILVRTGLLQLELAPGIVASARGGTALQLISTPSAPGAPEIVVLQGGLRIVHTESDRLEIAGPGRYRVMPSGRPMLRPMTAPAGPGDAPRLLVDYRPGVYLADGIVLRQNEMLKVDTQTFVRQIFGIFGR